MFDSDQNNINLLFHVFGSGEVIQVRKGTSFICIHPI